MIKLVVVIEKCEEGGFAAFVPTVPGCFSQGETIEEAVANITDAIELHLEPVDDDLIFDDDMIVKELHWERPRVTSTDAEPQTEAVSSGTPAASPSSQGPRPRALMLGRRQPPSPDPDKGSEAR